MNKNKKIINNTKPQILDEIQTELKQTPTIRWNEKDKFIIKGKDDFWNNKKGWIEHKEEATEFTKKEIIEQINEQRIEE